tara:strand:- start:152 stop:1288 length:1137 start_codon:yes stop_codon:yes gene_type:complete
MQPDTQNSNNTSKPIIVQKYGGSSVSSIESIKRVAQRIVASTQAGFSVVVVVSAMGNKTNELLDLAHQISPIPPRRELDLLVSVGERISMTLLAMAIEELGVQARSFTGSQSGIITDTEHVSARIIEVRPHRIERALEDGFVSIVAGFQGMSIQKEVTTLGRGGSDTTAVALTAALNAEYCEICSDVDGIYSADPNLITEAKKIPDINIDDALLLSGSGAKVLQHQALLYAKEKGISLVANATRLPVGKGTLIHHEQTKTPSTSIVIDQKLLLMRHSKITSFDHLRHTRMIFQQNDNEIYQLIDTRNLHGEEIHQTEKVSLITVVGSNCFEIMDQNLHILQREDIIFWRYQERTLCICLPPKNSVELGDYLHSICFDQ